MTVPVTDGLEDEVFGVDVVTDVVEVVVVLVVSVVDVGPTHDENDGDDAPGLSFRTSAVMMLFMIINIFFSGL